MFHLKSGDLPEIWHILFGLSILMSNLKYVLCYVNPLATEFFFLILAHPVYKMWIIQEPKKVALWNKRNFEEKKMESVQHV